MRDFTISRQQFLRTAGAAAALAALPTVTQAAAAGTMSMRTIPKSANKEQLPVIGLGTAQDFGAGGEPAVVEQKAQVIKELVAKGGKILDTAAQYSRGGAESFTGEVMEQNGLRDKIFLATKFAERGKEAGVQAVETAFKRLRTNMIDLMFVHNMVDTDTHLPLLKDEKAKGRFRYIGVSSTSDEQDRLTTWMDQLDFVEFAYAVDSREAEKKLLPMAADKGVAVLVALPLGRGRLLSKVQGQQVPEWAQKELGATSFAQLLLKFVVSHPAVTAAIPGTNRPQHMIENMAAGHAPLPDTKQRERIAAIWTA
jgi:aryl-alcohol dehydrogenase-like predicted oxidoreductase